MLVKGAPGDATMPQGTWSTCTQPIVFLALRRNLQFEKMKIYFVNKTATHIGKIFSKFKIPLKKRF